MTIKRKTHAVVTDSTTFKEKYASLKEGDVVLGRIRLLPTEEPLLLDLVERKVRLYPSALSQAASRSKTMQAMIFAEWMLPDTMAIHDKHQLMEALPVYAEHGAVVTKHDRKNAGQGIHRWQSFEEVYNQTTLGNLPYPFVLQPFLPSYKDVRVIILGDYLEAYQRINPSCFRKNLHFGGKSEAYNLTKKQEKLCMEVMARGEYPYAFIDLMISEKRTYLSEINLRGGIRGARLTGKDFSRRVDQIHAAFMESLKY